MSNGSAPTASPPARAADGPGAVLQLIISGAARTRSAVAEVTGLSRSTVGQRLEALFAAGLILETDELVPSRGRPSRALQLNSRSGVMISVDIGEERTRIAVTDLNTAILSDRLERLELGVGPEILLDKITAIIRDMLAQPELAESTVAGLGLGLPAPVDYDAGRVMGWSVMSGWEDFDIRGHLRQTWQVPILIDNDVNLMTLAEHRRYWPNERHLFYIKAGTGIGSGMIIDGAINRGAQGAAGDIGHAHIAGFGDPLCRCGNLGCLEALAGGWALARDLRGGEDLASHDARDVAERVRRSDSRAVAGLRSAGRIMGEAAAYATSLLNPDVIVLGGILGTTGDHLIAGVREVIYQRALPLATKHLRILPTKYKSRAAIAGAGYLIRDHVLDPTTIDRMLARSSDPFTAT